MSDDIFGQILGQLTEEDPLDKIIIGRKMLQGMGQSSTFYAPVRTLYICSRQLTHTCGFSADSDSLA